MHTEDSPKESTAPDEPAAHPHYRYEPHYNDAGRIIWERIDEPLSFTPETKTEQPLLNRAERRRLRRYIARKARAQMTVVKRRKTWIADAAKLRCVFCGLLFLGSAEGRCQCKAVTRREH